MVETLVRQSNTATLETSHLDPAREFIVERYTDALRRGDSGTISKMLGLAARKRDSSSFFSRFEAAQKAIFEEQDQRLGSCRIYGHYQQDDVTTLIFLKSLSRVNISSKAKSLHRIYEDASVKEILCSENLIKAS